MIEFPEYKYEKQKTFDKNACSEIICVIMITFSICLSYLLIMIYFINTEITNNTTTYIDHNR